MTARSIKTLLIALCIFAVSLTGCEQRTYETEPEEQEELPVVDFELEEPDEDVYDGPVVADITPDFLPSVANMDKVNGDVTGWLQVPGTNVDDTVLHKPDDPRNTYYLRIDINKNNDFNGVYYADASATFGDGTREQLGTNTCIYGHAITDKPADERYNIRFGQLHNFRDPEQAKEMPYIFFATEKENMAFEVIAVFIANSRNMEMPYNRNLPAADYVKMVEEHILPRSIYDYDAEISEDDKFLTLSTCIYALPDGTALGYPNQIRYAVLGRLVSPDEPLKETAEFTINDDMIVDPPHWPGTPTK